jgi:hypothetical protein
MSNTVTSYILVHDGGKLTVEDINLAVHGVHPLPTYGARRKTISAPARARKANGSKSTQSGPLRWEPSPSLPTRRAST